MSTRMDVIRASRDIRTIVDRDGRNQDNWIRAARRRLHELDRMNPTLKEKDKDRWTYGLTRRIWYGIVHRVDAWQMDAIRTAKALRLLRKYQNMRKTDSNEDIEARIARLEAFLSYAMENDWGNDV